MSKNKEILRVPCPHCYWVNNEYPDDYNLTCGDGDIGSLKEDHGRYYIHTGCDKCGEDFKIEAYIPEYVEAELYDWVDYKQWIISRGIDQYLILKAESSYGRFPIREAIGLIIKNHKAKKRPPELAKLKVDKEFKSAWKRLITECWDKRAAIKV